MVDDGDIDLDIITVSDNVVYVYVNATSGSDSNDGTVSSPYLTVDKAIDVALNDKTKDCIINISAGNYTLNGTKTIHNMGTIRLIGENKGTTIINLNKTRGFHLDNVTMYVNNLTFTNARYNGSGGVFLIQNNVNFTANKCKFTVNYAKTGSVIYTSLDYNNVKIYNSVFLRNIALSQGGALHLGGENSEFIISNSNFTNNSCNNTESRRLGGAIYSGTYGTLYINECDFTNNTALNGTAVYNGNGATINITNSNFSYNYGSDSDNEENQSRGTVMIGSGIANFGNCCFKYNNACYGGAISINSGENVYINSSIFYNNLAYEYGGAICNYGNLVINNSKFSQNNGTQRGGAIHDKGSRTLIILNTTFTNNRVNTNYGNTSGKGGAISLHDTTDGIIISNCTFNHSSAYYGGAIFTDNETELTINNTIFLNNTAKYGGALYTTTIVEMDIIDCIFDSNRAVIKGAAILFNGSGLSVKINNSNFTDNQAYGDKGEGGSIYIMQYIVLRVYGSYFNGNNATLNGGAFCSYSPVYMIITNTNLIYNNANNGGALYHNNTDYTLNSSLIHLKACVIYNNTGTFQICSVGSYDTFNNYNQINWTWFGQNGIPKNMVSNFISTCSVLLQVNSTLNLNSSSWLNDTVNINLNNDEIELLIVYGAIHQNQTNGTIPIRYADSFMSTLTISIILDDSTSYDLDLYYKLIDVSDVNKIEIILNNQKIILSR